MIDAPGDAMNGFFSPFADERRNTVVLIDEATGRGLGPPIPTTSPPGTARQSGESAIASPQPPWSR